MVWVWPRGFERVPSGFLKINWISFGLAVGRMVEWLLVLSIRHLVAF